MEATTIIRKPLITEKATYESSAFNRYAFEVDRRATKPQIKRAVEDLYGVRVVRVATQNRKGQLRRNRFGYWRSRNIKRAIVHIHTDDRIELF
jgi:large subunit ribosomal protein L23